MKYPSFRVLEKVGDGQENGAEALTYWHRGLLVNNTVQ